MTRPDTTTASAPNASSTLRNMHCCRERAEELLARRHRGVSTSTAKASGSRLGWLASTALYGALGVSIAALVRNQTTAATLVLIWLLAVEGIIGDLAHGAAVVQWLPAAAGRALVHVGPRGDGLPVLAAAGIFVLYVAAFAVAGIRLAVDRDIT